MSRFIIFTLILSFFFVLVGLFVIGYYLKSANANADTLLKEEALSSIKVISMMGELSCGSSEEYCLDEDKVKSMIGNQSNEYDDFWPVSSVKVYKVYPSFGSIVECPAVDCNYYEIYDGGQESFKEYAGFVSLCSKTRDGNYVYDDCEIAKLVVGVKKRGIQ